MDSSSGALGRLFSQRRARTAPAIVDLGTDQETFLDVFYRRERAHPGRVFLRQPYQGVFRELTYGEAGEEARRIAAALRALGHEPGDRVGIFSKNCYHWILADLAILMCGCVSVPYYPTLNPEALREVLDLSDLKSMFVGKLDAWDDRARVLPSSLLTISFPHYPGNARVSAALSWEQLRQDHAPLVDAHLPASDQPFTIIFTSGTTGAPKGVVLTYESPRQVALHERHAPVYEIFQGSAERLFSYLPLNHIAERFAAEITSILAGGSISFGESIESFAQNLQSVQPTLFFAVPRIWTKMQDGVLARVDAKLLARLLRLPGVGGLLKQKLRKLLGLGSARVVISGAAPLARATLDWFAALGIQIQEVYGMSEAGGGVTFNARGHIRPGSVGKPIVGAEVKIDADSGEVLIRAPWMMREYFRDPVKTAEVVRDGFIHSGDRGHFDAEGNLVIVGRVSEAFKSAKGKYVVPTPIEARFAQNPYIEQVLVTGRGLPQPIALVCLGSAAKGVARDKLAASLRTTLIEVNQAAEKHERVPSLVVLAESFSVENGLLTPTLKLRRHAIDARYEARYAAWSQENGPIWEG
ncbi:MAG TPA: AMP-binding protein [Polyangiales bacterium]